ncbi:MULTISPECIES: hypothetical protein [Nitrospirillum]|uniref:Phasin protein n=1 Tax=Nitrospirillum amazonense TaxID=28077 RepID=A0A560FH91_9PROT|nr:hypothetical protein [Nitrospirillum amazonense]MEC4589805.1 hypothetical protein [Nitrospirillum amazonense]TWB20983.1 hypothetical protein FBZ88_12069 [Nitrospirillum amazonense]
MPDAVKAPFPLNDRTNQALFGTMLSDNAAWLGDIQQVYGRMAQGSMAFFQEMSRFWELRMHEDREACAELMACRTPQELQECGQRFALKASQDYAEGLSRLLQASIGALEDGPIGKGDGAKRDDVGGDAAAAPKQVA